MAGKGIFKHIPSVTTHDMYGNNVNMPNDDVNIGAYNGGVVDKVSTTEIQAPRKQLLNI